MEAAFAALPEFDRVGSDAIPAPAGRQRHQRVFVFRREFGIALFERTSRRVTPTEAGLAYYVIR